MSNSTPGFIDPYRMAKNGQTLNGKVSVVDLSRANKLLTSESGEVEYKLEFSTDVDGFCIIAGELSTTLYMRCQRCLREFEAKVSSDFLVSPVKNDAEAKALLPSYEAVYVADAKLYIDELIEDELILAMPIVPMHDLGSADCSEITEVAVEDKKQVLANPFQVLQNLNVSKKGRQAEDK